MLLNNSEDDILGFCMEQNISQAELGRRCGWDRTTTFRQFHSSPIRKRYIEMIDALGYDIEITYIPKED